MLHCDLEPERRRGCGAGGHGDPWQDPGPSFPTWGSGRGKGEEGGMIKAQRGDQGLNISVKVPWGCSPALRYLSSARAWVGSPLIGP